VPGARGKNLAASCQRRTSGPQSVVRHSVDFGLPVTLMTQVVSCRDVDCEICSETIAS
jgi:hypothetical protein